MTRIASEFDGWTPAQYRKEILRLRKEATAAHATIELMKATGVDKDRDDVNDSKQHVEDAMVTARRAITADKIVAMVDKIMGSERPNPMAIREIARLAGADITEKKSKPTGRGVDVIAIRPHPLLLEGNAAGELSIRRQIEQMEAMEN